jgi:hypothetical protein
MRIEKLQEEPAVARVGCRPAQPLRYDGRHGFTRPEARRSSPLPRSSPASPLRRVHGLVRQSVRGSRGDALGGPALPVFACIHPPPARRSALSSRRGLPRVDRPHRRRDGAIYPALPGRLRHRAAERARLRRHVVGARLFHVGRHRRCQLACPRPYGSATVLAAKGASPRVTTGHGGFSAPGRAARGPLRGDGVPPRSRAPLIKPSASASSRSTCCAFSPPSTLGGTCVRACRLEPASDEGRKPLSATSSLDGGLGPRPQGRLSAEARAPLLRRRRRLSRRGPCARTPNGLAPSRRRETIMPAGTRRSPRSHCPGDLSPAA